MRVFVTGASGHIGSAVVSELVSDGHDVVGQARSDRSAAAVQAAGAQARRGDVTDLEELSKAATDADAVVHLAFDHDMMRAGDIVGAADSDLTVVRTLGEALVGTGKALVGVGLGEDADRNPAMAAHPRRPVAETIAGFADRGVRSVLVGIPQVVHSTRDRSGFLPILIDTARRTGVSGYVGEGANRWPAVNTLDLAHLYRLAVESAPAGAQLPAAAEDGVPVREIAETIARHLGIPAVSVAPERADEHFGFFGAFVTFDNPMPSDTTRQLLGWGPTRPGLLADLDEGHYFADR